MQKPLNQNNNDNGSGGVGFPGGQLLSAALGVTRAVTTFLGAALQVQNLLNFNVFIGSY